MIVLDASVVIALFEAADAHHAAARRLLTAYPGRMLLMNPVTKGEVLVNPARVGRLDQAIAMLDALGVAEVPLGVDAAPRLARLRVETGSKMPDCCVLLAAQERRAEIATFDDRLRRSAQLLGLGVLPSS